MEKLICIKTYSSRIEAELARGLLAGEGIKAIVSADDAGGARPDLLWGTGGAKLLAKEKDKEVAIRILDYK